MFNSVKSIALATSMSLAAISSVAFAAEPLSFSNINVEASMSAAENGNAMEVFPEIITDLQAAVAKRILASDDASDPTIRIDIRQISLNGDPMLTGTNEFNEIQGVVSISDPNNDIGAQSFSVNISAYAADQIVPEGYIAIPPSEEDFYDAMINGFADVVATEIDKLNADGVDREK